MPTQTTLATTSLTESGEYMFCYCKEDRGGEWLGVIIVTAYTESGSTSVASN